MTTLQDHLSALAASTKAEDVRYMSGGFDRGPLFKVFGREEISAWTIGSALGEDTLRGCYNYWPVYYANGEQVGELRDDANGYTFHDHETGE